jgi:ubiquitin C-terminal hydrolase
MAMVLSIPYSGFPSDVEPHQKDEHDSRSDISCGSSPAPEDSDNDALMDSVAQQGERQQLEGSGMTPSSSSSDIMNNVLNEDEDIVFSSPTPPAVDEYWEFPSTDDSNDYVIVPHQDEEIDDTMNMDMDESGTDPLFGGSMFQVEPEEPPKYGGLSNLGNTCYMASALQMLASLNGSFVRDLKACVPPAVEEKVNNKVDSDDAMESNAPLTLRDAFLEVLDGLSKGETIRPEAFKRCIDERTGLFLGYRQQDSHEFLTTLLDLLDEDYKKKDEPDEKKEDSAEKSNGESLSTAAAVVEDETMENDNIKEEEERAASSRVDGLAGLLENEDEDEVSSAISENQGSESAMKKLKVDEDPAEESTAVEEAEEEVVRRSSSFIHLGFGDIEELLHGDTSESPSSVVASNPASDRPQHKCKLVGGRMNTSQAELTRYDESKHVDLEAMAANNDSSSKLGIADESMSECSIEVKSPVESNFTTEVRVSLTCDSCKYRRSHTETYLHLSLELGTDSCFSVEDCVRKFFAPEKREIKCEKCFHSSAMQTTEVTKLPNALLFHLKRFIVDVSPDYTSISYRKNQSPISFEERIPLDDGGEGLFEEFLASDVVVPNGSSYAIRSVVNHIGASASCGHYTADAKREYVGEMGEEHREWTRFNDSYVTKISSSEAVADSSNTAYMIMYELEK